MNRLIVISLILLGLIVVLASATNVRVSVDVETGSNPHHVHQRAGRFAFAPEHSLLHYKHLLVEPVPTTQVESENNKDNNEDEGSQVDEAGTSFRPVVINGIPTWGQMDPRWANLRYLGGKSTIGAIGCALTSIAMADAFVTGTQTWTPAKANGDFHGAVSLIKQQNLGPFTNLWYNIPAGFIPKNTPAANDLKQKVRNAIKNNSPVVLGMQLNGPPDHHIEHGWTRHTVLATGVGDSGDILLNDPATGTKQWLSAYEKRPQFTGFDMATAVTNHARPL